MIQLTIHQRLDAVLAKLQDPRLLNNRSIGNEIGFYIFDYDPEYEPLVQQRVDKGLAENKLSQIICVFVRAHRSILVSITIPTRGRAVSFHFNQDLSRWLARKL